MSSRKLSQQKLFQGTTPVNSRAKLNSTTLSSSKGTSSKYKPPFSLNTTVLGSPTIHRAPVLDTQETENELTYNTYLQNLYKKMILEKVIREKKIQCNDTLESLREKVFVLLEKEEELLEKIEEIEIAESMEQELIELKDVINKSEKIIDADVKKQVGLFVDIVKKANNKLYLEKVLPLKNEEEYKEVVTLIEEICSILEKVFSLVGDVEGVGLLAGSLRGNLEKFKEVEMKSASIEKCQNEVAIVTMEKASNYLASNFK